MKHGQAALFERVVLVLSGLTVFVGLVYMGYRGRPEIHRSNPAVASLTCRQAFEILKWSTTQYGGPTKVKYLDPAFGARVAEVFAEKMDPYKVMFVQSEVQAFQNEIRRSWPKLVKSGDCGKFELFLSKNYNGARRNLQQRLTRVALSNWEVKTSLELADITQDFPVFDNFATSASELNLRLAKLTNQLLEHTSLLILQQYQGDFRNFFSDSLRQILTSEEVDTVHVVAKATLGAMDNYSTYMPPEEYEDFFQDLEASKVGLGIKIRRVPRGLYVERLLKDGPADRSKKIHVGDVISKVNGYGAVDLTVAEAKKLLKGGADTEIVLGLIGPTGETHSAKISKGVFAFEEARIHDEMHAGIRNPKNKIGVIEIPTFYGRGVGGESPTPGVGQDLENSVRALLAKPNPPAALVLDLRGNPGGYLDEAVSMAGLFLGNKPVAGVVEKDKRRILKYTRAPLYKGPLVVMVDKDSASAAEVLAGALKDHRRALIVGDTTSYGKGSVQRMFHLEDELPLAMQESGSGNGVVKLTTSVFYSPLGHSPANGGVTPNILLDTMNPAEEKPHRGKMMIPESTPFLDQQELADLNKSNDNWEKFVSRLQSEYSIWNSQQLRTGTGDVALQQAMWVAERLAQSEKIQPDIGLGQH